MEGGPLGLYTTVHPGSLPYVADWLGSVERQTDAGFDVWIGVDLLEPADAIAAMGGDPGATWVCSADGDSPAALRSRALERMVERYAGIVLVDSDDVLAPGRVEQARRSLARADVCGCPMRVVDAGGAPTGAVFGSAGLDGDALARRNCFGLGNTAFRGAALAAYLPVPPACVVIDWFLMTRAWAQGARIGFDSAPGGDYRQHGHNMTAVLPPFDAERILSATELVLDHYALVLGRVGELGPRHRALLVAARDRVSRFLAAMIERPRTRERYIEALNRLPAIRTFWDSVAHPDLDDLWTA